MSDFNPNAHLNEVLNQRDKELGIGGNPTHLVTIGMRSKGQIMPFLHVPFASETHARTFFDQIDESNIVPQKGTLFIALHDFSSEKQIDYNELPNAHTIS